jgi:nucleoid-associated protein YgaU
VRLPIAALLVGFGFGVPAGARQRAVPPRPADAAAFATGHRYVHTIAPRDTLIAVSRSLLADPRRWPVLQRLNHVRDPRRLRPGGPIKTRSWWWILEPIAVAVGLLVAM